MPKKIEQNEETIRYLQFLKNLGINKLGPFAEAIGVSPVTLYSLKKGYNNLSLDVLRKTYIYYDRLLNLDFIFFGEGHKFIRKPKITAKSIATEITAYQHQTKEELKKMETNLLTAMGKEAKQLQKEVDRVKREIEEVKSKKQKPLK